MTGGVAGTRVIIDEQSSDSAPLQAADAPLQAAELAPQSATGADSVMGSSSSFVAPAAVPPVADPAPVAGGILARFLCLKCLKWTMLRPLSLMLRNMGSLETEASRGARVLGVLRASGRKVGLCRTPTDALPRGCGKKRRKRKDASLWPLRTPSPKRSLSLLRQSHRRCPW